MYERFDGATYILLLGDLLLSNSNRYRMETLVSIATTATSATDQMLTSKSHCCAKDRKQVV